MLPGGSAKGFHAGNFIGRLIVGAVGSRLGGGKYENGALTAAFEYLFNHLNGFSKKGDDKSMYEDAEEYLATKKGGPAYYVTAHGGNDGVWWKDDGYLSPDQMADKIEADPTYKKGMTVVFLTCNLSEVLGYGQKIANRLGSMVMATDQYVWYGGEVPYSAWKNTQDFSDNWAELFRKLGLEVSRPGKWTIYSPK
jgi:hypothetical protein